MLPPSSFVAARAALQDQIRRGRCLEPHWRNDVRERGRECTVGFSLVREDAEIYDSAELKTVPLRLPIYHSQEEAFAGRAGLDDGLGGTLASVTAATDFRKKKEGNTISDSMTSSQHLPCAYVPQFLVRMIQGDPACAGAPGLVRRSGNFLVRPNPSYFDYARHAKEPKQARHDPRGFRLCAWWVHPALQAGSPYFPDAAADARDATGGKNSVQEDVLGESHGDRIRGGALRAGRGDHRPEGLASRDAVFDNGFALSIDDLEAVSVGGKTTRYLMSWKDLSTANAAELVQLRIDIFAYLEEVFDVSPGKIADYDLQFHTTHALRNPAVIGDRGHFMTLHLQVGVNYCWSLSCLNRFKSLDWVIKELERLQVAGMNGAAMTLQEPCFAQGQPHCYLDETCVPPGLQLENQDGTTTAVRVVASFSIEAALEKLDLLGFGTSSAAAVRDLLRKYSPTPAMQELPAHARGDLLLRCGLADDDSDTGSMDSSNMRGSAPSCTAAASTVPEAAVCTRTPRSPASSAGGSPRGDDLRAVDARADPPGEPADHALGNGPPSPKPPRIRGTAQDSGRQATLIVGFPGSGKSTLQRRAQEGGGVVLTNSLAANSTPTRSEIPADAVFLDGDTVRQVLQSVRKSNGPAGAGPEGVREFDRSRIKRELFALAVAQRRPLCLTMAHPSNADYTEPWQREPFLEQLRSAGYEVNVVVVLAPYSVCAARLARRKQERFERDLGRLFAHCVLRATGTVAFLRMFGDDVLEPGFCAKEDKMVAMLGHGAVGVGSDASDRVAALAQLTRAALHELADLDLGWTHSGWLDAGRLEQASLLGAHATVSRMSMQKPKHCLYILGLPASGKTTAWRTRLAEIEGWFFDGRAPWRVIDGELFGEAHAGLNLLQAGEEQRMATAPHQLVKPQIDAWKRDVFSDAIARGHDMLCPVTGTSLLTDEQTLDTLQDNGYGVHVLELHVGLDHAARWEEARSRRTGRRTGRPRNMDRELVRQTAEVAARLRGRALPSGRIVVVDNEDFKWEVVNGGDRNF